MSPSPYTGLTDSTEVIANYLYTQLQANMSSFTDSSGNAAQDVWYGDDSYLLPRTPALCVVPGPEVSVYNGVGGRPVMMTFTTFVMVYYGKLQDHQLNVHGSLTIANSIKRFINADVTLGGNAIDSFVAAIDPGVAIKGGAMLDTTRMTFKTRSKVTLNA